VDPRARVRCIGRARVYAQHRMGISVRWIGGSGWCRWASTERSVGRQVLPYDWLPGVCFFVVLLFSWF
jgi:hypothetical protein